MLLKRNLLLLYAAAFLRAVGVGLTGVILGIYLARLGFSAGRIGLVVAAGLAGVAAATALVSFGAERLGRRRMLLGLATLSALGGLGLGFATEFAALLAVAFLGMVNGMGRDRGAAYALDQAVLPAATTAERRTWTLAWYTLLLDAGHAVGALAGTLPVLLRRWLGADLLGSYQLGFFFYAAISALSIVLYLLLSPDIEATPAGSAPPKISPGSRKFVRRLASLTALDSLGGGFLTSALIAYWFFRQFGVAEESLGVLFFAIRLANAGSYLVAAWLARRIGLVNTMVFTHIPSSLILLAVPLAPTFEWAVGLFLLRECLVQMDVPTRQSYVVAVVEPHERAYASGMVSLTRNLAWATAPSLAGSAMQQVALATPLYVGGALKIAYDILLYAAFRKVRPPEEQAAQG